MEIRLDYDLLGNRYYQVYRGKKPVSQIFESYDSAASCLQDMMVDFAWGYPQKTKKRKNA